LRRFQQEEQSLSGFSIPQAQDSLRNYPPPPSMISATPTSARVRDFDDLRNYPEPTYSNITPATMRTEDLETITDVTPQTSVGSDFSVATSGTPSRIGLGNEAFHEYTRATRGRPPNQLMRTYSEPRRYDYSEGAGSSSGVSSVSSTSVRSQLDTERPELARARSSVGMLSQLAEQHVTPELTQALDNFLSVYPVVQQDVQSQRGTLAPARRKTKIKVRRQGSVQTDPNY